MDRSAADPAGGVSEPPDGSGGVRNAIVGGEASVVVQSGVISGDVTIPVTIQRALPGLVARQLPPSEAGFIGRERELEVLLGVLNSESPAGTAVISAVAGMAGVGKTALAVRAARQAADRGWFPGGVLFLDLRGYDQVPVGPAQALDSLLRGLGVPGEEIPPEAEDRAGLYRSVLADLADPALLVLDNASAAGQVRPLLPGDARHRVLVTSRHTLPQLGGRLLELAILPAQDSVGLLDAAVRGANPSDSRIVDEPSWSNQVAAYCGHLPLALQIAAALLLFDPIKPVAELAEELAEAHTRLDHLDDGERAVRAAFDLSYRRLPPDQARLFRLLAVHPGPDVATGTVAVLANRIEPVTRKMLAELARAHLIEPAPLRGRWQMHDLIRIYAEQAPSDHSRAGERQRARRRFCEYLVLRADAADDHLRALPGTPVPAEFTGREEALAWFDGERAALVAVTRAAADNGLDDIAHHLPARLVEYFMWRRHLDDWLTTAVISRDAAVRLADPNLEVAALVNYGYVLRELRRCDEAADACRSAITRARTVGDRHLEAAALVHLGVSLRHIGNVDEAVRVCQQAVDAQRRLGDRRGEAMALNNLVNALQQAGRLEEAATVSHEHIDLCRRIGDRIGESMALTGFGNVLQSSGQVQMSVEQYEAALAISRDAGNSHMQSLMLNNLGEALKQLGQAPEALATYRRDLEMCQETQDLSGEARALVGIASALSELGHHDEARATCQQALEAARESGHEEFEANALATLMNILFESGHWREALVVCRQAADAFHRTGESQKEAMALHNLGRALDEEGRPKEAIRAYNEAGSLCRSIGDRHSEALVLSARGTAFLSMRRIEQAERDYKRAAAIARKLDDVVLEGRALVGLGGALLAARRPADAITILRRAAGIARQGGDRHFASLALAQLGGALFAIDRADEAFAALHEATELNPDADPLDLVCVVTGGKVASFSRFLQSRMTDVPDSTPTTPRPGSPGRWRRR